MTNKEARELLKQLEDRGTVENNLSMDQIYALRVVQGALDDIAEYKRLLNLAVEDMSEKNFVPMYVPRITLLAEFLILAILNGDTLTKLSC